MENKNLASNLTSDICRIVEFASKRDMERAIDKFDDYDLNGRRIKVVIYLKYFGDS